MFVDAPVPAFAFGLAIAAALALAAPSAAQVPGGGSGGEEKRIEAVRVASGTPDIDGRVDDAAWSQARWISDFTQKEPNQGGAPTVRTEIAFLYDEQALYVGARLQHADPARIGDAMTRRDDMGTAAERLTVSLDTYHDRRTAYSFAVTAAGVRIDWFHPADDAHRHDHTFNPVWEAETEIGAEGWTAEMRIPFSQLRFSGEDVQLWGVNVSRYMPTLNEDVYWVVVPRDVTGWSSRFGELTGISGIEPSRRIELLPYAASEARRTSDALIDPDDPFHDGRELDVRVGLDFKMGLGPNLTLDATINPDFGQVEADPAQVNLSAFETFFEERRPFFTEGQQSLSGTGPTFYYSRRIGAAPHRFAGGDFRDAPNTTTILGAAKVTGQLASGWTVGALAALTDDETARIYDAETDAFDDVDVEPRTGYGAVRMQKQFGESQSTVGFTVTGVERALDDGPLAGLLTDRALAGGVDWNRRFQQGRYELLGHVGFSHVTGDSLALARIQRGSAHYFQRPDAGHVDFDPTATSMSGWSAAIRGGKRNGAWRWNGGVWADSPGFEINDLGQNGRADDIAQWSGVSYQDTEPGKRFRYWNVGMFENASFNFGGVHRDQNAGLYTNWTLTNFVNGFFEHGRDFTVQDDTATRGGPLMEQPGGWWIAGGVFSNQNSANGWGTRVMVFSDDLGGWQYRLDPEFRYQPSDRLRLSIEPRFVRRRGSRQFVTALDGGREETFGRRYVFGWIDQSEVAAPVRANWSFSPDLSLELYAEPFAASGRYFDLGELARPETSDLRTYGDEGTGTTVARDEDGNWVVTDGETSFEVANRNFDVLSFRSNLVLRWDWRAGSSLFVVWQQNRSRDATTGALVRPGDLLDSLSSDGDDILAVKVNYWLPF